MNQRFRNLVEGLEPKFRDLLAMDPVQYGALPKQLPKRAIYLFSEGADHLYVGRTNNLRNRLRGHCAPSSGHFSAVFAFRLARHETGLIRASYKREGSRAQLSADAVFGPVFAAARIRVSNMDLRFVEEEDPVKQALLEIYVATVLETRYNDFDNH
jgi:hypothetical protein